MCYHVLSNTVNCSTVCFFNFSNVGIFENASKFCFQLVALKEASKKPRCSFNNTKITFFTLYDFCQL